MSYGKIGLTTVAVTQDLLSGMPLVLKIELIHLWSSILPELGQPSAQLSKLIRLTACKKAMHATSWWYRTVYIPWLVSFYDMHKGKHLLNSNPPNHRGNISVVLLDLDAYGAVVVVVPHRVCPSTPAPLRKSKQLAGECHR